MAARLLDHATEDRLDADEAFPEARPSPAEAERRVDGLVAGRKHLRRAPERTRGGTGGFPRRAVPAAPAVHLDTVGKKPNVRLWRPLW